MLCRSTSTFTRRGLTLIEVLIVIAIIAVLAAISVAVVFPIWRSTQAKFDRKHWRDMRLTGQQVKRKAPMRVLFIGNSYTAANELAGLVQALAKDAGDQSDFEFETQLVGGATLEQHWNEGHALAKIQKGNWDFVVLQEQSLRPIFEPAKMHDFAAKFDAEIRKQEAFTVYFLTWARQNTPEQQSLYNKYTLQMVKDRYAEIAPVGIAWQKSLTQNAQRKLHDPDGSHPNPVGSYLAACVFYGVFYDKSPEGLTGTLVVNGTTIVQLSATEARTLQSLAWLSIKDVKQQLKDKAGK